VTGTVDNLEDRLAAEIKACMSRNIASFIALGNALTNAQRQLTAGWGEKTGKWKGFLKLKCQFSPSYASRYQKIAKNFVICNDANWPALPLHVEVLYELATAFEGRDEHFTEHLNSGKVNVHTTVEEAKALKTTKKDTKEKQNDNQDGGNNEEDTRDEDANNKQPGGSNDEDAPNDNDAESNKNNEHNNSNTPPDDNEPEITDNDKHFFITITFPFSRATASRADLDNWQRFVTEVREMYWDCDLPSPRDISSWPAVENINAWLSDEREAA
jgi:hypothetical protein